MSPSPVARRGGWLLLLLLAVAFVTRAAGPALDPPTISWSRGEYSDPGFYLNNARSLILGQGYQVGTWNNGLLFPVFHSAAAAAYRVLGYSPAALHGLLGAAAAVAAALLALGCGRILVPAAGLLAAGWFVLAAPLLLLGRVPVNECLLLPLLCALPPVLTWNETRTRQLALLALVLLAVGTKYSALFVLVPLAGVWLARRRGWLLDTPPSAGEARWCWLPLLLLTAAAAAALLVARPEVLRVTLGDKLTRYHNFAFGWKELFLPVESNLFWRMPELTLSAWLGFGVLLFRERRWGRADLFAVLAVAGWYLSIVFVRYNPARYQLPVVPFLLYLAVRFWTVAPGAPVGGPIRLAAWWGATVAVAYSALFTLHRSLGFGTGWMGDRGRLAAAAALAAALLLAVPALLRRHAWRWPAAVRVALVLAIAIAVSFPQCLGWWQHRDDRLAVIGRELGALVPPGETVGGWYAPSTCLHNRLRVFTAYRLTPDQVAAGGIRWLLLEGSGPDQVPYAAWPEGSLAPLAPRLRLVRGWPIPRIGIWLGLYEVRP